jgi:hypothetical protein
MRRLGRLRYPFIAASAALLILGLVLAPLIFSRYDLSPEAQFFGGFVVGVLASVVLYAVMRAIAERPEKK